MTIRAWIPAAAAVTTAAMLLTGCGSDDSNESGATAASTPTGIAAPAGEKDFGAFRTTPQPDFGPVNGPEQGAIVEGQKMAEFVSVPTELDPTLLVTGSGGKVYKNGAATGSLFVAPDAAAAATKNGMIAGFSSTRRSGASNDDPTNHELTNAVLRFPNAAAAEQAATDMSSAARDYGIGDGKPYEAVKLAALPDTLASGHESSGADSIRAFTAHGSYVLYQFGHAPSADKAWINDILGKTVQQQSALIDQFPSTAQDKLGTLPIDVDHVLTLSVPPAAGGKRATSQLAVYGQRGGAHMSQNPATTLAQLKQTGVDRVASDVTYVYRAKDADNAGTLRGLMVKERADAGAKKVDGPAGVPDAECVGVDSASSSTGREVYCWVSNGRYVGEAGGTDEKTVKQTITAQFMILDAANK